MAPLNAVTMLAIVVLLFEAAGAFARSTVYMDVTAAASAARSAVVSDIINRQSATGTASPVTRQPDAAALADTAAYLVLDNKGAYKSSSPSALAAFVRDGGSLILLDGATGRGSNSYLSLLKALGADPSGSCRAFKYAEEVMLSKQVYRSSPLYSLFAPITSPLKAQPDGSVSALTGCASGSALYSGIAYGSSNVEVSSAYLWPLGKGRVAWIGSTFENPRLKGYAEMLAALIDAAGQAAQGGPAPVPSRSPSPSRLPSPSPRPSPQRTRVPTRKAPPPPKAKPPPPLTRARSPPPPKARPPPPKSRPPPPQRLVKSPPPPRARSPPPPKARPPPPVRSVQSPPPPRTRPPPPTRVRPPPPQRLLKSPPPPRARPPPPTRASPPLPKAPPPPPTARSSTPSPGSRPNDIIKPEGCKLYRRTSTRDKALVFNTAYRLFTAQLASAFDPVKCAKEALADAYSYFGVVNGNECYGLETLPTTQDRGVCAPCTGPSFAKLYECGSASSMTIYDIFKVLGVPAPPPPEEYAPPGF